MASYDPGACARTGAEWLDRRKPGWYWDINLESLDATDRVNGVAAQILGGLELTGMDQHGLELHGFDLPSPQPNRRISVLDAVAANIAPSLGLALAWLDETERRRWAGVAGVVTP